MILYKTNIEARSGAGEILKQVSHFKILAIDFMSTFDEDPLNQMQQLRSSR